MCASQWIYAHCKPLQLFSACLETAFRADIWIVLSVFGLWFLKQRLFLKVLNAIFLQLCAVVLAKLCMRKVRPTYALRQTPMIHKRLWVVDQYSMPSGHAAMAFLLASFAEHWLAAHVGAVGVALSRVIIGRHFIDDVVVGAAIGHLCARVVSTFL